MHTVSVPWSGVHDVQRLAIVAWQEGVPRYPELNLVDHLILPNFQVCLLVLPHAITAKTHISFL